MKKARRERQSIRSHGKCDFADCFVSKSHNATSLPSSQKVEITDDSSIGSPGSPPSSPLASNATSNSLPQEVEITDNEPRGTQEWQQKQRQQNTCKIDKMDELYGIDSDALQYELEDEMNFVMNDGTLLSGEALLSSLTL